MAKSLFTNHPWDPPLHGNASCSHEMTVSTALQPSFRADLELTLELRSRVCCLHYATPRPPHTRAARPPWRGSSATRSSSAAGATRDESRPHWTSSTPDNKLLSCLNAGVGERPSPHPAVEAKGSGRRGRPSRQKTSKGAARDGRGGGGGATMRATDAIGWL